MENTVESFKLMQANYLWFVTFQRFLKMFFKDLFVPSMNTAFKDVNLKVKGTQEIYKIELLLILMISQPVSGFRSEIWLTSNSFIMGTGLKKCNPPNLSFRLAATAISVMGMEEVLLVKMVCLDEKHAINVTLVFESYIQIKIRQWHPYKV